jgi:acetolactate synthase-1/2/3 large subunit
MAATEPVVIEPPGPLPEPPEPDPDALAEAVRHLAAARNPMIMCGAGAQGASEEVTALAELLGAPVTAFRSGRGVVAEDHPLSAPPVVARQLFDDVDVLLGIGSRLEMPYMRWRDPMRYEPKPDGPTLIRIDIDPAELTRLVPDVGLVTDAAIGCRRLYDALSTRVTAPAKARTEAVAAARARARELFETRLQPQTAYLDVLRARIPRDGFLVPELSQAGFATYTGAYPVLAPRTYVTEGFQGTLGFGFPTALGVKIAHPGRAVVSITGDGGFMFGVAELATAAQHGIGVVTVVFNNNAYGNVLRDQRRLYEDRIIGSTLENPDFVSLAESFGVAAERVSTPADLGRALEAALAENRPALIEVALDPSTESSPWPLIHMTAAP